MARGGIGCEADASGGRGGEGASTTDTRIFSPPTGEQAVALEPGVGDWRRNRGVARALTGDFAGAIADLERHVAWERRDSLRAQYQGWIDALRAGRKPFTPELLERLRN